MAGEQHEHPAVRGVGQVGDHLDHRRAVRVLVLARLGEIVGDAEEALRRVVERRGEDLAHRDRRVLAAESEPGLQKGELAAGRQRGAGEDDGVEPVEEQLAEHRRQVERHRREADALAALRCAPSSARWACRRRPAGAMRLSPSETASSRRMTPRSSCRSWPRRSVSSDSGEPVGDRLDRFPQRAERAERRVQLEASPSSQIASDGEVVVQAELAARPRPSSRW